MSEVQPVGFDRNLAITELFGETPSIVGQCIRDGALAQGLLSSEQPIDPINIEATLDVYERGQARLAGAETFVSQRSRFEPSGRSRKLKAVRYLEEQVIGGKEPSLTTLADVMAIAIVGLERLADQTGSQRDVILMKVQNSLKSIDMTQAGSVQTFANRARLSLQQIILTLQSADPNARRQAAKRVGRDMATADDYIAWRHDQVADEAVPATVFDSLSAKEHGPWQLTTDLTPTEETGWRLLRSDMMLSRSNTGNTTDDGRSPDTRITADYPPVVMERLAFLGELSLLWDSTREPRITAITMKSQGKFDFWATILSQTTADGRVIEHAVLETASTDNATYVFRAESGLNPDNSLSFSWRDVFNGTYKHAKLLGARKIVHGRYHADNVVEYLTRKTADLEHEGYDR